VLDQFVISVLLVTQLEKKSRELMQMQRSVVDLQYRLVEDRNQWQLEVSQLQRHLEDTRRNSTQQKEAINHLLAEVWQDVVFTRPSSRLT